MRGNMNLCAFGLLVCALCAASSWCFEAEFYGTLEEDLQSTMIEEGSRFAREAPEDSGERHHRGPGHFGRGGMGRMSCCGKERFRNEDTIKEKHEAMRSCFKEASQNSSSSFTGDPIVDMFSCERVKEMKKRHICITECFMKKLGTVDEDGKINVEKIKERNEKISEVWMRELSNSAAEKCASSKVTEIKDETGDSKCNSAAINFKHCMWKEVILTCPEEEQLKTPEDDPLGSKTIEQNKINCGEHKTNFVYPNTEYNNPA